MTESQGFDTNDSGTFPEQLTSSDRATETAAPSVTGVTAAAGFRAAATTAGIKPSGKSDMALVVND